MEGQYTMFAELGEYLPSHGRRLKWEELKVGDIVLYDASTQSTKAYQRSMVDGFTVTPDGYDRVLLNYGKKQRTLVDKWRLDSGDTRIYAEPPELGGYAETHGRELHGAEIHRAEMVVYRNQYLKWSRWIYREDGSEALVLTDGRRKIKIEGEPEGVYEVSE